MQKKYTKAKSDKKIQILLDFLGSNILGMKIEDIKGSEILEGNIVHIKNFLELILALTNIDEEKNAKEEEFEEKIQKSDIFASNMKNTESDEAKLEFHKF